MLVENKFCCKAWVSAWFACAHSTPRHMQTHDSNKWATVHVEHNNQSDKLCNFRWQLDTRVHFSNRCVFHISGQPMQASTNSSLFIVITICLLFYLYFFHANNKWHCRMWIVCHSTKQIHAESDGAELIFKL